MNETDNVFDITDYGDYFIADPEESGEDADLAVEPSAEEIPADTDEALPSADLPEETGTVPELPELETEPSANDTYSVTLESIDRHISNVEMISIGILAALGILIGIQVCRALLDRF